MRLVARRWLCALLLTVVALSAAGCVPGGAVGSPGWTVVAAEGDAVFSALPNGKVVALDAVNGGQELWSYPSLQEKSGGLGGLFSSQSNEDQAGPLDGVYGVPALTDDLVLVASYDHRLYAFDRHASGTVSDRLVWGFAADAAIVGGATIYDGVAYFGSSDYRVYAVDLETGQQVWEEPFATGHWVWGAPAVDEERVYVGSMDHHAYAIDRATGHQVWQVDIGGSVPGSVALADGVLFVGGVDKRLHALRAEDGQELWVTDELGGWVWGKPLVHEGYVYVGSLDGEFHAFEVSTGSPRWKAVSLDGAIRAGAALLDGYLIVGSESGMVYQIDVETGDGTEFYEVSGGVLSRPAVVGNMVYVGTTKGNIYALGANRGVDPLAWVYPPEKKE